MRCEGQGGEFAEDIDGAGITSLLAQWNTVGAEKIGLRQAKLQRIEAKDISNRMIHGGRFPLRNVVALRCFQPVLEAGN